MLFMMPEVIAGYLFPRRRWENNLTAYRVLCGIAVVGNLMMMMMANLVGFAVGVDGLKSIIYGIFKDYSGTYISFFRSISSNLKNRLTINRSHLPRHSLISTLRRHPSHVRSQRRGNA